MTEQINISTAHPTKFKLVFPVLPFLTPIGTGKELDLWCTAVSLPDVTLNVDKIANPFYDVKVADGKITVGDIKVSYSVDELFQNYYFLYNWMMYIKFPDKLKVNNPVVDATLHIYSNNDNPKFRFVLKNIFPTSMEAISFSTKTTDSKDIEHTVTFALEYFTMETSWAIQS